MKAKYLFPVVLFFLSACSHSLTEQQAKNTVDIWLNQNDLRLLNWNGLVKVSENEMVGTGILDYHKYSMNNPPMEFTFTKTSDNGWVFSKVSTPDRHATVGFSEECIKPVFVKVQ